MFIIDARAGEDEVICDFCNGDYSDSDEQGGILIGSYAICPECASPALQIRADKVSREGESFKEFVLRIRQESMK
jgi:hypothetical protein